MESVHAYSKKIGRSECKVSCSCRLLDNSLAKPDLACNNPIVYVCIRAKGHAFQTELVNSVAIANQWLLVGRNVLVVH